MGIEDPEIIHSKIEGCIIQDAGAYEEETLFIPLISKKDSNSETENA